MKLKNLKDIEGFFKLVEECEGKVELVGEDIRLNLKSKLSQYFSLAQLCAGGDEVEEIEIVTEKPEDANRIMKFMINGGYK